MVWVVWTPDTLGRARKGLGNNLAQKCLERWNAAVGVDEGKNAFQPTSVRVLLMTGSKYTVERRDFENWSSTWPIVLKIWKWSLQDLKAVAFQQDTSRQGYSPDPSSYGQKGLGSKLWYGSLSDTESPKNGTCWATIAAAIYCTLYLLLYSQLYPCIMGVCL